MSDQTVRLAAANVELVDASKILGLKQALGILGCQEMMEDAVFRITDQLSQLDRYMRAENLLQARPISAQLMQLTAEVGLSRMSAVSANLNSTLHDGDIVASHAITARLVRLGEESLFSLVSMGSDDTG